MPIDNAAPLLERFWSALPAPDFESAAVEFHGEGGRLPSVFDVTSLAAATVAVATRAVARLLQASVGGSAPAVAVDRRQASAAFRSEALFTPLGWTLPAPWDPIAGDYRAADGWIRLHTNYASHRAGVERVLGPLADQGETAAAVTRWNAVDLETAVVAAGGCAAAMHDRTAWSRSAAGRAAAAEPWVRVERRPATEPVRRPSTRFDPHRPLAGVRVLDLTRVIAGPMATRFLAGYGADVLRIDPPGFEEVPALVPITTAGKRCAALDLRQPADRARFEDLVATADVLISGLRADALAELGYPAAVLRRLNPNLIEARLNAYGWSGPWSARRGFDSLVQMSCGIAAAGAAAAGQDEPKPLPAQALDHGTGYLLAGAVVDALAHRRRTDEPSTVACSLIGTANVLMSQPTPAGLDDPAPTWTAQDTELVATEWGAARAVPVPGRLADAPAGGSIAGGSLGRHRAEWASGSPGSPD